MTRAAFLRAALAGAAGAVLGAPAAAQRAAGGYDFWFTRLKYNSGDWDVDQRMPANLITSMIDYTTLRVDPQERVVALADPAMLSAPFCYLVGHKAVEFSDAERRNFERYVRNGGFVFVDDCNHDIDGLFAKSFEAQMATIFGASAMKKLPGDHPVYTSFFKFDGPPATSFELNGWGDDLIHDYLKGITINGRLGVLYSNKDYGCEWDYDWRNKRFLAEDNTRFGVNIIMYALSN
ncbi:MAG: twin-arginine translocation pathway signal [Erythrobacter sp.]|nr:twin-arginine translocation pathway signal [Erythrobacter sp.]MBA4080246.1 twin-arginine translocation pathway signal [Erythrobacter sp.]